TLAIDSNVAVVGAGGSGKDYFGLLLARLAIPTTGQIRLAGRSLLELPEAVTGRRLGYVDAHPFLQSAAVRAKLLYALKHRPVRDREYDDEQAAVRARDVLEAQRAGNIAFDFRADWVDYEGAGVAGPEAIFDRLVAALEAVEMTEDIYHLGLRGTV